MCLEWDQSWSDSSLNSNQKDDAESSRGALASRCDSIRSQSACGRSVSLQSAEPSQWKKSRIRHSRSSAEVPTGTCSSGCWLEFEHQWSSDSHPVRSGSLISSRSDQQTPAERLLCLLSHLPEWKEQQVPPGGERATSSNQVWERSQQSGEMNI